ncbi:MAG: hypothetical protein AAGH40_04220 [Verrucomicrobiota bacterium]
MSSKPYKFMPTLKYIPTPATGKSAGFALVISLSLMAFILLLVLSMVTLMQVENTTSDVSKKQMQAQQNAILSLQIALGELQKNMGPDQRVSARADILDSSSSTRSNRIGVWSAQPDGSTLYGENYNRGDLVAWLASDARDPSGNGYDTNYNQRTLGGSAAEVEMLGAGSLPSTNGTLINVDDAVILDMTNTTIENDGLNAGRYAWWVDDEGLKARVNLEREEPGNNERELRAVLETMAFNEADASALPAFVNGSTTLESVGFDDVSGRLVEFQDLKTQLPESQIDDFNPYFSDLTTWSSGVQSDVRNGGLKKDLSLAFEMSDENFLNSRFGFAGKHSYEVDGFGWVQPVFALTQNGDVLDGISDTASTNNDTIYAHGPLWSLLRQYYRIYQQIENPLTDPVFQTQVFGPNVEHSTYPISASEFNEQPALQFSGGQRGSAPSSGKSTNDLEPQSALLRMLLDSGTSTTVDDQEGDPYRANIDRENILTPMATATYGPYMLRMLHEFGISFNKSNDSNTDASVELYRLASRARSTFVIHNPYNVKLEHPEMNLDFRGPEFSVSVYDLDNGDIPNTLNKDGSIKESNKVGNIWENMTTQREFISHARIRESSDDPMNPGEIRSFRGVSKSSSEFADEITSANIWTGFNVDKTEAQELLNPYLGVPTDEDFVGYTFVGRVANFNNARTNYVSNREDKNNDPKKKHYSMLLFSVNTFMDDGAQGNYSTEMETEWPLVSSLSTAIAGVNSGYQTVIDSSQISQSKLETAYPMSDNDFINGPNSASVSIPYAFGDNGHPDAYTDSNNPIRLVAMDYQLKPIEFDPFSSGTTDRNPKYPAFILTNPMAPVKDNKNLLPADDIVDEGIGFGAFSPGWSLSLNTWNLPNGPSLNSWGPTDGTFLNSSSATEQISPVMLELPTAPLLSLGKLQFANITIYDHMPALAISNSLATPYVPLTEKYEIYENRYGNDRIFMDMSYLMNEALWDSYFFSSLSLPYVPDEYFGQVQDTFDAAFDATNPTPLPNPRITIELSDSETIDSVKSKLFENGNPSEKGYLRSAENLLVKGSFNINSTSLNAWRTILAGARDQSILTFGGNLEAPSDKGQTPLSRYAQAFSSESDGSDYTSQRDWGGFRSLSDRQIEDLAESIVQEIEDRSGINNGPFLSLASFINRNLSDDSFGRRGLLQAAIEKTAGINTDLQQNANIQIDPTDLNTEFVNFGSNATNLRLADESNPSAASIAPNYILQGDILQAIGSHISARSDTFRIRSYGESLDPISGRVEGKAWCEAVVQRMPEPVSPPIGSNPETEEYWSTLDSNGNSTPYGRRFKVVSFRWLDESDV